MLTTTQQPYLLEPVLNFNDLRLVITRSIPNQLINVICRETLNDGYGGLFSYDFNSNLADDNISIIAPTTLIGRWIRVQGFVAGGGGGGDGYVTLNGDVIGQSNANTVIKLQGNNVSDIVPTDGYVLTWSTALNEWIPFPTSGSSSFPVPTEIGQMLYSDSSDNLAFTIERPLMNDNGLIMTNDNDVIVMHGD